MNEKQPLSPDQIQAKLRNLQQPTGQARSEGSGDEVNITVASQREAYDLQACRRLLEEHDVTSSKLLGSGFQQVLVVSRSDSSRALDLITAHRDQLLRKTPLSAGDYVVGILAWALGCGLFLPAAVGMTMLMGQFSSAAAAVTAGILLPCSLLVGGFLGYLRCAMIASRRRQ